MTPFERRRFGLAAALIAAVAIAGLAACGDDAPGEIDGGTDDCTTPRAQRYLPFAVDASWTYEVHDGTTVVSKTSTVLALEDVGERKMGVTAYRIRTDKTSDVGDVLSWQEDRCTSVVRHREQNFNLAGTLLTDQFFVPSKLRIDESAAHTIVGASWTSAYTEVEVDPVLGTKTVSKDETWTVEATDESVTVPAGTFSCLKIHKVSSGQADKRFWFARGIGKIKEEGEQTELLTAYSVP